MSQEQSIKTEQAEARTQDTRTFVRQVRAITRRKYTPEEKIRIVLEGFRREPGVLFDTGGAELILSCRTMSDGSSDGRSLAICFNRYVKVRI